jgi:ATP-binding cassette, subfamily C, bacterial LapB
MAAEASSASADKVSLASLSTLRANIFDLAGSSLFLNILGLALPMSLLQVYDRILPNKSTGTMVLLLSSVLVALLLESVLSYCRSWVTGWVGAKFEHKAGCTGFERLLTTSLTAFENDGSGIHLERMNSLGTVRDFYGGQAVLTMLDLPFAALYLSLVAIMGGWLVLVPITLLLAFALTAGKIGIRLRTAIEHRMVADDRRFNFLIEVLGGIHSVKAMSMEAQMARRYERLQESCAHSNYEVALESANALGVSSFFSQATMVAVAACGALIVIDGNMTTGGLAACSMLSGRAMAPLQKALGVWTRFQTFLLSRKRIEELFALPAEAAPDAPKMPEIKGRMTMEQVSFRYSDKMPWIIQDADIDIGEGECVAICGGNGSGKSTLLALMQGALKPSTGNIRVDGQEISSFDPQTVREQIAYLPQQGVLFQGTIVENMTLFRPNLDEVAVEMAGLLGLDEVVASMAYGFDTPVGDGAYDSLPRGIKQRIAIARALVNNPRCVLFDEANTAIDTAGDNYLRVWLERARGKRTLVLVTHRPSLVKLADRVYDLVGGRLKLRGARPPASSGAPTVMLPQGGV